MAWRGVGRGQDERERGQVLVLSTLFLVVLLGMAALVIDVGRLAVTRRQLQNAADAGALAGAWRLPVQPDQAKADAQAYALKNGVRAEDGLKTLAVTENRVYASDRPNDTIAVTTERTRAYTFGRVLGLTSKTLHASATVQIAVANGFDVDNDRFFPYAVWGGNVPRGLGVGTRVTYRSNQYDARNVKPHPSCQGTGKLKNCNWDVTSNTFKGYFHWQTGATTIYLKDGYQPVHSQGGNATGTQAELARLIAHQKAGTPVILPVIDKASDADSNLKLRIIAFVCVKLDPIDTSGSSDWTGVITEGCVSRGRRDGPAQPPVDLPPAFVAVLVQ